MARPWWQHQTTVILALVYLFPVGLWLMWRHTPWDTWKKWVCTATVGLVTLLIVALLVASPDEDEAGASNQARAASPRSGAQARAATDGTSSPISSRTSEVLAGGEAAVSPSATAGLPSKSPAESTQPTLPVVTSTPVASPTFPPPPPPPAPPPPPPVPPPPPPVPVGAFGDGTFIVGTDIAPGTYRAPQPSGGCYWERLAGFSGELEDILSNGFSGSPQLITILSSDAGFSSRGCGRWTNDLSPVTANPSGPFGEGMFIVGTDVASGTWRSEGAIGGCYWARLAGFTGGLDEVIANQFSDAQQIVTIAPTDAGFESNGCGNWTKIG